MDQRCTNHQFELIADICRNCGDGFCKECLVYSFGPKKPPYCVSCALAAAGVRSNAARPQTRSRREIRKLAKERRKLIKTQGTPEVDVRGVEIDWSIPGPTDQPAATEPAMDWLDDRRPSGDRVPF
jgi:hypothetical protein